MASDQTPSPTPAGQALERLGSLSLRTVSMEELLQLIADLAKTVLPGNPEASVSLLVKDRPTTVAKQPRRLPRELPRSGPAVPTRRAAGPPLPQQPARQRCHQLRHPTAAGRPTVRRAPPAPFSPHE